MCTLLTGCAADSAVQSISDAWEYRRSGESLLAVTPDGNDRDFLLQDYDVKEVEEDSIDELPTFDVSGPNYKGITEVGGSEVSSESVTTSKPVIYLSTYHNKYAENSPQTKISKGSAVFETSYTTGNYSVKYFANVCKQYGKNVSGNYGKFGDYNKYYKTPKKKYVNKYLAKALEWDGYYGSITGGHGNADWEIANAAHNLIHNNLNHAYSNGDFGSEKALICNGYSYESTNNAYSVEKTIMDKMAEALRNAGYTVITAKAGSQKGLSIIEKANAAKKKKAAAHIILWARDCNVGFQNWQSHTAISDGWLLIYKTTASKKLSKQIAKVLCNDDDVNKHAALSGGTAAVYKGSDNNSYKTVASLTANSNYYACLNYANKQLPTCLFIVGDYLNEDARNATTKTYADHYVDAVVKALKAVEPVE